MSVAPRINRLEKRDQEKVAESVHETARFGNIFPFDVETFLGDLGWAVSPSDGWIETCNVDTALIYSQKLIRIQTDIYMNSYERARMSLAHELAHLLLHKDFIVYVQTLILKAKTKTEYYEIMRGLPEPDATRAEQQAFYTGGAILAPKEVLRKEIVEYIGKHAKKNQKLVNQRSLYKYLAKHFGMTDSAIFKRVQAAELAWIIDLPKQDSY